MTLSVAVRQDLGAFTLDVAFEGPADGVTALFGPSGAGKSATLAAIAGLAQGAMGRIALGGEVWLDSVGGVCVPAERRGIGLVHQDARLFPHMNVRANLLYGWRRTQAQRRIGLDAVVGALGIGHLLARRTAALSGGEAQRVAIGRALLAQPRLLLLDEPFSALDAARRAEALALVAGLKRFGVPMVYVSHRADEVRALADHVVRIAGGRVVGTGLADAGAIEGRIVAQDADGAEVEIGGRRVRVPGLVGEVGARVRIGTVSD